MVVSHKKKILFVKFYSWGVLNYDLLNSNNKVKKEGSKRLNGFLFKKVIRNNNIIECYVDFEFVCRNNIDTTCSFEIRH